MCERDVDNLHFPETETYVEMEIVCELNGNTIYYLFTLLLLASSDGRIRAVYFV